MPDLCICINVPAHAATATFLWGEWAQAPSNSQWEPAWWYLVFVFLHAVWPLAELRWPTNPRCPPCRRSWAHAGRALCHLLCGGGNDVAGHSDEPLSILWAQDAGNTGGVAPRPSTGAPARRQQPKSLSESSSAGWMQWGNCTILDWTFSS